MESSNGVLNPPVSAKAARICASCAQAMAAGAPVTVSVFAPDAPGVTTVDDSTRGPAWVSVPGDHSAEADGAAYQAGGVVPWQVLAGVAVAAPAGWSTVVAFGDSITAGYQDAGVAGHPTWPELLAARAAGAGCSVSVVNEGISANQLTADASSHFGGGPAGLRRFAGDVLAQPGLREVIVDLGINDLAAAPRLGVPDPVTHLEQGYRALVAAAHDRGVRVLGATLSPAGDPAHPTTFLGTYSTAAGDAERARLNRWIRTSHTFDGVIDFARALRSGTDPNTLATGDDSGDHLHPSDTGYGAMVAVIPPALLPGCAPVRAR